MGSLGIRTSPLTTWFGQNTWKESYVAKADLLFLFANKMKWGSTWKKVISVIIKPKMWSKCYCRTSKRIQFTTIKYKVQNKRKKRRQVLHQLWGFSTKIIPCVVLQARDQFLKYKQKMCAKQSPLFPMLMCKLL